MSPKSSTTTQPDGSNDPPSRRSSPGRFEPDDELLAAGEPERALEREIGIPHPRLRRALKRRDVAARLDAIRERLRLEQEKRRAAERRWEKELPRLAGERKEWFRRAEKYDELCGHSSADRLSINDTRAAQLVAEGGGIQELIEATGLRTRLGVYESIDPRFVQQARANDRKRAKEAPAARGGFEPSRELIVRRAARETLSALAEDCPVSESTLSRAFNRPDIKEKVRAAKLVEQQRKAAQNAIAVTIAARYAAKIKHVWCPVHNRPTYVRKMETSNGETRLEIGGCCEEAIEELRRWLEIYRPYPRPESVPPMPS